jgi:hypothetical protein
MRRTPRGSTRSQALTTKSPGHLQLLFQAPSDKDPPLLDLIVIRRFWLFTDKLIEQYVKHIGLFKNERMTRTSKDSGF